VLVREHAAAPVVTIRADDSLASVQAWLASGADGTQHQGFPVLDSAGVLCGVVTRRDLVDGGAPGAKRVRDIIKRTPSIVFDDSTLREAADHMVAEGVGRLPVVTRAAPQKPIGIITRSDILAAHGRRLADSRPTQPRFDVSRALKKVRPSAARPS
jgi:CBS domain-containing protein